MATKYRPPIGAQYGVALGAVIGPILVCQHYPPFRWSMAAMGLVGGMLGGYTLGVTCDIFWDIVILRRK
jgi:hypothetical protein